MTNAGERPVFVVLVNYNGWQDTIECLDSILALEGPARVRIIVADNASTNDSVAQLKNWAAKQSVEHEVRAEAAVPQRADRRLTIVTLASNKGFAAGNNAAMRMILAAREPAWVWLLNNDMVAGPQTLTALLRTMDDERIGAVGGLLLEYNDREVVQAVGGGRVVKWHGMTHMLGPGLKRSNAAAPRSGDLDFVSGGCLFTKTEVLERIGLLDERFFMYAEDVDWCARLTSAGLGISASLDAPVWHKGGRSAPPGGTVHDYHIIRSSLLLVHGRWPALMPFAIVYSVVRCLGPKIVMLQWQRVASVLRAYRDLLF